MPDAFALWFVVLEAALEVDSVGVDPSAIVQLALLPVAGHLHARFLEQVSAIAVFVAVLPPARVHVAVLVSEDALTMAATVLPVAVVLANIVVELLADATFGVGNPATLIAIAILITIDAVSVSLAILILALIDVTVLVGGCAFACEVSRRLHFNVCVSDKLVFSFTFSVLTHSYLGRFQKFKL